MESISTGRMPALDHLDREHLDALLDHPGWALLCARIDSTVGQAMEDLLRSDKDADKNRGKVEGLRLCKDLPKRMIEEAKAPSPESPARRRR